MYVDGSGSSSVNCCCSSSITFKWDLTIQTLLAPSSVNDLFAFVESSVDAQDQAPLANTIVVIFIVLLLPSVR